MTSVNYQCEIALTITFQMWKGNWFGRKLEECMKDYQTAYYNYCDMVRPISDDHPEKQKFTLVSFVVKMCKMPQSSVCITLTDLYPIINDFLIREALTPRYGILLFQKQNGIWNCLLVKNPSKEGNPLGFIKGKINMGEDPITAAERETLEETGLSLNIPKNAGVYKFIPSDFPILSTGKTEITYTLEMFTMILPDNILVNLNFKSSESQGLEWVTGLDRKLNNKNRYSYNVWKGINKFSQLSDRISIDKLTKIDYTFGNNR
jgi:8-oxo-dGTP pyrophosphatase MutT (NUDIX family)